MRATVGHCSSATRSDGRAAAILTLWVEPEVLQQVQRGQELELHLSPSLPTSPPDPPVEAACATAAAMGSEGDPSSPSASPTGSPKLSCEPELQADGPPLRSEALTAEDTARQEGRAQAHRAGTADVATLIELRREIEELKLDYRAAADAIEAHFGQRPSAKQAQRGEMLEWLQSQAGQVVYGRVCDHRPRLLAALKTVAADQRPELVRGKRPGELSLVVLRQALALLGIPDPTADGPRQGRCASCDAPIVWLTTTAGKAMPCDPELLTAMKGGRGKRVTLVGDDGVTRGGLALDPEGTVTGREAHWSSCPSANRHRRHPEDQP